MSKFEPRLRAASESNPGAVCCTANTLEHRCAKCQAHAAAQGELRTSQEATMTNDYTPAPQAYAADLARLRAAAGQTEYFRALDEQVEVIRATAAKTTAANAAAVRALSAVDMSTCAPPNSYAEPLRKMREGR